MYVESAIDTDLVLSVVLVYPYFFIIERFQKFVHLVLKLYTTLPYSHFVLLKGSSKCINELVVPKTSSFAL